MVLSFISLFENIYTRHYLKMRKMLTGAKLLLMSIIHGLNYPESHQHVIRAVIFFHRLSTMDDFKYMVIEKVREMSLLWDPEHVDYKNKDQRQHAWEKLESDVKPPNKGMPHLLLLILGAL